MVVNKVDRGDARPDEVHTEVFDLFAALGADDEQLDFPMLYASGRQGWADDDAGRPAQGPVGAVRPGAAPRARRRRWTPTRRSRMVASILEYDNFLGRVLTGRVEQGRARVNMPVKVLRADGTRRSRPAG